MRRYSVKVSAAIILGLTSECGPYGPSICLSEALIADCHVSPDRDSHWWFSREYVLVPPCSLTLDMIFVNFNFQINSDSH